jgi:hypothetical protein
VIPLAVSYLSYNYVVTLRHRIWLTLVENFMFYGIAGGLLGVGLVFLLIFSSITWDNVVPLVQSIANIYGSVLFCITLGYGFIALPKMQWQLVTREARTNYHLVRLEGCFQDHLDNLNRAHAVLEVVAVLRTWPSLVGRYRKDLADGVGHRLSVELEQVFEASKFGETVFEGSNDKAIRRMREFDWSTIWESPYEDYLCLVARATERLEGTRSFLVAEAAEARESEQESMLVPIRFVLGRLLAVVLMLISAVFIWGECVILVNKEYSVFYQLSRFKVKEPGNMLISAPILAYLVFVGSWSLTGLKLGAFYRFIKRATNSNTLYYFGTLLSRLAPTIAWHYLQQIGASDSLFEQVMGNGSVIMYLAWDYLTPLLFILMMVMTAFRLPERIAKCCCKRRFIVDYTAVDTGVINSAKGILSRVEGMVLENLDGTDVTGVEYGDLNKDPTRGRDAPLIHTHSDS